MVCGVKPGEVLDGIGVNIAAYRRAVAITQVELAVGIGRSVEWVPVVEQERRHADLLRIATVVGCGVEDLIGRRLDPLAPRNAAC